MVRETTEDTEEVAVETEDLAEVKIEVVSDQQLHIKTEDLTTRREVKTKKVRKKLRMEKSRREEAILTPIKDSNMKSTKIPTITSTSTVRERSMRKLRSL